MLKNKILSGMVLFILVISPTMAIAKDMHSGRIMPRGKWWYDPQISSALNLNEAEKARLDEAFLNSRRKLIKLKSVVEGERFELGNLLEREALDEAAVMQQFKKLEGARTELSRERFNFLVEVRKILGHERFRRIKEQPGKLQKHRMHRNMEGPDKGRP